MRIKMPSCHAMPTRRTFSPAKVFTLNANKITQHNKQQIFLRYQANIFLPRIFFKISADLLPEPQLESYSHHRKNNENARQLIGRVFSNL
ncbi:MAG: hypothetical protein RR060_01070, partial [Victivallaceae bacterium]